MCAFYYVHWPHNVCSYQNQCFLCSPADSGNCSVVMSLIKTLFFLGLVPSVLEFH